MTGELDIELACFKMVKTLIGKRFELNPTKDSMFPGKFICVPESS